jgi:hypothetical protein
MVPRKIFGILPIRCVHKFARSTERPRLRFSLPFGAFWQRSAIGAIGM